MAVITISRGSYAGGKELARRLGERLGHPVLGREALLERAAEDYGIDASDIKAALGGAPPFWREMPAKAIAYVKCVTAALLDRAEGGNLIYHGHVGHLLLTSVPHVLRVRVIAPEEDRLRAAMAEKGVDREAALAHVRRVDEERRRWAERLYGVDWTDPAQYDIVVNLARVGLDGAVETVAHMATLEPFRESPAASRRFQDLQLAAEVWAALARDPETRSAGIDVEAQDCTVTIRGSAGSLRASERIPEIARGVKGVREVQSEAGVGTDWFW